MWGVHRRAEWQEREGAETGGLGPGITSGETKKRHKGEVQGKKGRDKAGKRNNTRGEEGRVVGYAPDKSLVRDVRALLIDRVGQFEPRKRQRMNGLSEKQMRPYSNSSYPCPRKWHLIVRRLLVDGYCNDCCTLLVFSLIVAALFVRGYDLLLGIRTADL